MQRGLLHPVYSTSRHPQPSPLVIKSTLNSFLLLSPYVNSHCQWRSSSRWPTPQTLSFLSRSLSLFFLLSILLRSFTRPISPSCSLVVISLRLSRIGVRLASNQSSFSLLRRFHVVKPFNTPLDYRMKAPVMLYINDVLKFFICSAFLRMRYFGTTDKKILIFNLSVNTHQFFICHLYAMYAYV